MTDERTTPFGLWYFASDYLSAAQLVGAAPKHEISAPRYYLLGHAAELALKAFLLSKGVPLDELKSKIVHDLEKAFTKAVEFGLTELALISPEEEGSLLLLNKTYKPKEHEYIVTGYRHFPSPALIESFVTKVQKASHAMCLSTTISLNVSE
jgi:hypothetical protein